MASRELRKTRLCVKDVLAMLNDGNDSDFGDESESDDGDDDYVVPLNDQNEFEDSNDDDPYSEEDDQPLAKLVAGPSGKKTVGTVYRWQKTDFQPPDITFGGYPFATPLLDDAGQLQSPLQYFRRFITRDMLELVEQYTNQYSIQKTGTCVNTKVKEIEQVIGMVLRMGIVQMPGVRVYFEIDTRYDPVADLMGRNRFQLLLRTIHFVDNEHVPEEDKLDKLWKIRPFLDKFREQCLLVTPEEYQAIDEMMVPFKGRYSHIKQYLRGKPNPWGFKIWCRCSKSGMLHDFEVYQGKAGTNRNKSSLGVAGDVVSKLSNTLPSHKNYKLFADNLFTSVGLLEKLKQNGFQYTGTVRANRLRGCTLKSEKELSKIGRGTSDYRVEQETNIVCVRWLDTKMVTLMSTCVGTLPLDTAKRWDKTQKEYKDVSRPLIIKEYNSNMGGIDLLDSCVARYKFLLKSRRWYMYLFWHCIQLAVVNAWLLYRRDCQLLALDKPLILRRFQAQIASGLVEVNATKKRGRPSHDRPESPNPTPQPKRVRIPPSKDSRKDQFGHWPIKIDKRRRCAICQIKTDTNCEKCGVPLCFTENRNCFREYHV